MVTSPLLGGIVEGATFQPVSIVISGDHIYKNRGKGKNGCGHKMADGSECMQAMFATCHLSLPLSLNVVGSRGGNFTYKNAKAAWEGVLLEQLVCTNLPIGWKMPDEQKIEGILAEGEICFPVMRKDRDQGNFRWFIEKCLGDALVAGGYLEDDSYWPTRRYEFGSLDMRHEPGVASTTLMLFPR